MPIASRIDSGTLSSHNLKDTGCRSITAIILPGFDIFVYEFEKDSSGPINRGNNLGLLIRLPASIGGDAPTGWNTIVTVPASLVTQYLPCS